MQRATPSCWRASNPIIGLSLLQRASAKKQKNKNENAARPHAAATALALCCITRRSTPVFHFDAVLPYTRNLAGAVDARLHVLSVKPNMKRVRCAGQSSSGMQPTDGAGRCNAWAPVTARPSAKCSAGVTSMSGAAIWRCCTTGIHKVLPRKRS